jgi:pimeloyl-ACP methyl ester carboxylesterase
MWPFAVLRPLPKPSARPQRFPVVLVHGFMGHPEMMRPLARRLLSEGWPRVDRVGYPSLRVDLEAVVASIAAAVIPLAEQGPVDLVGHSLGGLACRAWIKELGGHQFVRRFVSLGTPHAGTSLYRVVPTPLRDAFDPRGVWVRKLAEGPEPVPTTVIRARYDHQVLPPERGSIPGVREIVLQGYGHNGLLWARPAHDAVLSALSAP